MINPLSEAIPENYLDKINAIAKDLAYCFKSGKISPQITVVHETDTGESWADMSDKGDNLQLILAKWGDKQPKIEELKSHGYVSHLRTSNHHKVYRLTKKCLSLVPDEYLTGNDKDFLNKLREIAKELAIGHQEGKWSSVFEVKVFLGAEMAWYDYNNVDQNGELNKLKEKYNNDLKIFPSLDVLEYLEATGDNTYRLSQICLDLLTFIPRSIFIAYSSKYKYVADKLDRFLTSEGHNVYWDKNLIPAQEWQPKLDEKIIDCDVLIYLLTPESVESPYCKGEYNLAVQHHKFFVPILLHPDVKVPTDSVGAFQHVDFAGNNSNIAESNLLVALKNPDKLQDRHRI